MELAKAHSSAAFSRVDESSITQILTKSDRFNFQTLEVMIIVYILSFPKRERGKVAARSVRWDVQRELGQGVL